MIKYLSSMCLIIIVTCRMYNQQFSISQFRRSKGWIFIDRMRFERGTAKITFNTKLISKQSHNDKSYTVELGIVPDNQWATQSLLQCSRKAQSKIDSQQYIMMNEISGQNSLTKTSTLQINIEYEQTYHFILRDCERTLINQYFSNEARLQIGVYLLNNSKQHGQQQRYNGLMLLLLAFFTIAMIYLSMQIRRKIDNELDWWKLILNIALWINLFAIISKLSNHFIYVYINGVEYGAFDFFYLLLHSISQSIITSLLIFVAYGWTITFINSNDLDLYIPLLSMLGIVNIILTMLSKINDSDHDKYHMYDSIPAYILVFFRIVAVIIFVIGVIVSVCSTKSVKIKSFYYKYVIVGLIYFLSLPVLMLMSTAIRQSMRAQFVFMLVEIIKNTVNMVLTYMVTYRKSQYRGIKYSNQSFMEGDGNKYL